MKSCAHYTTPNLWAIMKSRGQSMAWLARAARIDRTLLYRMKWGQRPITAEGAQRIATAMQLPFDALFFLADDAPERRENEDGRRDAAD